MNFKMWVSWGVFGATTARQRACGFASWGIRISLPLPSGVAGWLRQGYWWQWAFGYSGI
jgi:hypothetical protein